MKRLLAQACIFVLALGAGGVAWYLVHTTGFVSALFVPPWESILHRLIPDVESNGRLSDAMMEDTIQTKYGGPYVIDLHVVTNPEVKFSNCSTTVRATFKESDRVYIAAERAGQNNIWIMTEQGYQPQWQYHGAEVFFPDETFLFEHEIVGLERDPLRFSLDKDLGWVWTGGSGFHFINGRKIPVPPRQFVAVDRYELFAELRSEDWMVRAESVWKLSELKDLRAREAFWELLEDPVWVVRRFSALGLGMLGFTEDAERLAARLPGEHRDVRRALITAMGELASFMANENQSGNACAASGEKKIGSEKDRKIILDSLWAAVESDDRWIAETAAESLFKQEPERVISRLQKKLIATDSNVHRQALVILAKLRWTEAAETAEKWAMTGQTLDALAGIEALMLLDCDVCREVIQSVVFGGGPENVRFAAFKTIQWMQKGEYEDLLMELLADKTGRIRQEAARLLNYRGWKPDGVAAETRYHFAAEHWKRLKEMPEVDGAFLGARLAQGGKEERIQIAECLAEHQNGDAFREILALLDTGGSMDEEELGALILAASAAGDVAAETIERFLGDARGAVQAAAIQGAGMIGKREWIPRVVSALGSKNSQVRKSAAAALEAMNWVVPEKDRQLMAFAGAKWDELKVDTVENRVFLIETGLTDGDETVRQEICRRLAGVTEPAVMNALITVLADTSFLVADAAVDSLGKMGEVAVPALAKTLKRKKCNPAFVIRALGLTGSSRIFPLVKPYLTGEDWNLRNSAYYALMQSGYDPENVSERAIWLLAGEQWTELANLGEAGWKKIEDMVNSPDERNVVRALHGLRFVSLPRGIHWLIASLDNRQEGVGQTAQESLLYMGQLAMEFILEGLQTGTTTQRKKCAEILGLMKGRRAHNVLKQVYSSEKDKAVKEACRLALQEFSDTRGGL